MNHFHRLIVGDWSEDGHSQKQFVAFKATHDRKSIVAAYLAAAQASSFSVCDGIKNTTCICSDYEETHIPKKALDKLAMLGITKEELLQKTDIDEEENGDLDASYCAEGMAYIFLRMVQHSLPEFEFELLDKDNFGSINGFWQQDLNGAIGYGILGNLY